MSDMNTAAEPSPQEPSHDPHQQQSVPPPHLPPHGPFQELPPNRSTHQPKQKPLKKTPQVYVRPRRFLLPTTAPQAWLPGREPTTAPLLLPPLGSYKQPISSPPTRTPSFKPSKLLEFDNSSQDIDASCSNFCSMTWNVEGLHRNIHSLKYFIDLHKPHLVFLSEPQTFQCDAALLLQPVRGCYSYQLNQFSFYIQSSVSTFIECGRVWTSSFLQLPNAN